MQPQDKQKLLNDAYKFLQEQTLGVISTVSSDGTPESACVNFMLDTNWNVLILTNQDSRKVQNIRHNPKSSFVVAVANIPNTAQIQADTEITENGTDEFDKIFQQLKSSSRLNRDPIYSVFSSNYVILKLKIYWFRWLYFDSSTGKGVYTVLIP
ncbi:MAG TPA: pyridoxamine 5'-phosphate oxidase family protein [Patescibacteria group bacterium]|nr:pyridoxamine 5'-phosphate oxidase family protein [Patescibacteria group bacterium]